MTIFNEILKLQLKLLKNKFGDIVYSEYLNDAQLVKSPLELENFCNKLGRKTDVNMNMILMSIGTAQKMETLKEKFDYDYFIKSRATEVKMSHDASMYGSVNEDFNKIKIPTMIIKGAKDVAVPMKVINEFTEKVPQTQLEIFDNCKHWVHLDEPQKYFEKISNFINKNFKEGLN